MPKIDPLPKITGLKDERSEVQKESQKAARADQSLKADRIEISAEARLVQKVEKLQQTPISQFADEIRRVGDQWYRIGYHLENDNK